MTQQALASSDALPRSQAAPAAWGAVSARALCVAVLIASEFLPISLLPPIATDLGVTEGRTGQAISISGIFAVLTSLFVSNLTRGVDRRIVLTSFSLMLVVSGTIVTFAPSYLVLMVGRALLGVAIGGFWSTRLAGNDLLLRRCRFGRLIVARGPRLALDMEQTEMISKTVHRRTLLAGMLAATIVPRLGQAQQGRNPNSREPTDVRIRITFKDLVLTATLYDTPSARDFASMLPLSLKIEDYGSNEKIVRLPRKLTEEGSGPFSNEQPGDLCYFRPWGNLALFYDDYRWDGLIRLGRFDDGFKPLRVRGEYPVRIERL